jgi:transposase
VRPHHLRTPELQTFRRTLLRWRHEILASFGTGLSNGRTDGFNNKAKLGKKARLRP